MSEVKKAADDFAQSMSDRPGGRTFSHLIIEAFLAGAEWQRKVDAAFIKEQTEHVSTVWQCPECSNINCFEKNVVMNPEECESCGTETLVHAPGSDIPTTFDDSAKEKKS